MKNKLWCLIGAALLLLDQLTKRMAARFLREPFVIWDGVLELRYHENTGMAFSMMRGRTMALALLTILVMAAAVWLYVILRRSSKWKTLTHIIILFLAGGTGNLIDRIVHGYVVDFVYIKLIDFPIFNLADNYVTFAMAWLIWLMLFRYREEDVQELAAEVKGRFGRGKLSE